MSETAIEIGKRCVLVIATRDFRAATRAVTDLRHLHAQMIRPGWTDKRIARAARGLLGPAIEAMEVLVSPLPPKGRRPNAHRRKR